jgi:hydroxyacylglutathione hydrolase
MTLLPLPAFTDNYIWLLHDGQSALVVDPGAADPVSAAIDRLGLRLQAILVTHHHPDHVGGLHELQSRHGPLTVYGPARELPELNLERVSGGQGLRLQGLDFEVIDVPGHTAGHIAYFAPRAQPSPLLFCGDTLFSGGCGRLFEGTPAQMLRSLDTLAALPGPTRVCCAHEYTLSNLAFAQAVEPGNLELAAYRAQCVALREAGEPTLPSTIERERLVNPFLRSREPAVIESLRANGARSLDEAELFGALREWKNRFR